MIDYAQHVTELGNLQPFLRAAAARNDWPVIESYASRMADLAARIYATAKAEGATGRLTFEAWTP